MARNSGGIWTPDQQIIINGNYDARQRAATATHTTTFNVETSFLHDRMFTLPVGASVTSAVDSTAAHLGSGLSVQGISIIGLASVTTVDHGQIISSTKRMRYKQSLLFSASIFNHTGAAFTPLLRFDTPGTAETNAGRTFTNRSSQSLQLCASAAVTRVSAVVDPTAFTNIDNGLMCYLRIPSGSLDSNTKDITVSQFSLKPATAFANYVPPDPTDNLRQCQEYEYGVPIGEYFGACITATAFIFSVALPVDMRAVPTLSHTVAAIGTPSGTTVAIYRMASAANLTGTFSSLVGWNLGRRHTSLRIIGSAFSAGAAGDPASLITATDGLILLNAELS